MGRPGSPIPPVCSATTLAASTASCTRLSASSVAVPALLVSPAADGPRSAASRAAARVPAAGGSPSRDRLGRSGLSALTVHHPPRNPPLLVPPAVSLLRSDGGADPSGGRVPSACGADPSAC